MDALTVALISGLVAAVVGSIIGAAAAVLFQRWSEGRRKLETRRFRVYMGMLDVYQRHFWIRSYEIRNEEIPRQVRYDFEEARWKVADQLREADDLDLLPEVVDALFSLRFASEGARGDLISVLIERLSRQVNPRYAQVNPRYAQAMKAIGEETMRLIQQDMQQKGDEWMTRRRKIEPL